jgi:hypothetical protein
MWLSKGIIDATDEYILSWMLAEITLSYQERIEISVKSNLDKAKKIKAGMIIGLCSPLILAASMFLL